MHPAYRIRHRPPNLLTLPLSAHERLICYILPAILSP
jgi:hypothetical protein